MWCRSTKDRATWFRTVTRMTTQTRAATIPAEILLGNPERSAPAISPDGQHLSWLAPHEGVMTVWVDSVDSVEGGGAGRVLVPEPAEPIRTVRWAYDGLHVLYLADEAGDENFHLHAVDVHTGADRDLTPFAGVRAELIGLGHESPGRVAVALNLEDRARHDLYVVDLATADVELAARNESFQQWFVDQALRPRAALRFLEDGSAEVVVPGDESWVAVDRLDAEDLILNALRAPIGLGPGGTSLHLVSARNRDSAALVRLDLRTGTRTTVVAEDGADVADVVVDPRTRAVQLVAVERARVEWIVTDPEVARDLAPLLAADAGDLSIIDRDLDCDVWIVAHHSPSAPVRYSRYERRTREVRTLFLDRPALTGYTLADVEPFSYSAGDGLEVHGYATFPVGRGARALPTVLLVHGGPWARDRWALHPVGQLLANRGYLVLQVNFRGSTGYGRAFMDAGDRQWGAAMHDDLVDAVAHAVACGWSDPDRVAIMGSSYGGYAALVGATLTPEVFRCAVAVVAPSNLNTLIESFPPYWGAIRQQFLTRVGDPATDGDMLWSRSPLSRISELSIPLLLAHGANDPRVKRTEFDQVVEVLEAKAIPHTAMVFDDEGHGFTKPQNNLRFLAEAERFLAEHLGES